MERVALRSPSVDGVRRQPPAIGKGEAEVIVRSAWSSFVRCAR